MLDDRLNRAHFWHHFKLECRDLPFSQLTRISYVTNMLYWWINANLVCRGHPSSVHVFYHNEEFPSDTPGSNGQVTLNRNQTLQGCRSTEVSLGAPAGHEHKTEIAVNHPIVASVMFLIPLAAGACSALARLLWVCQHLGLCKVSTNTQSFDIAADQLTHNCNTFVVQVRTLKV